MRVSKRTGLKTYKLPPYPTKSKKKMPFKDFVKLANEVSQIIKDEARGGAEEGAGKYTFR